MGRGQGTGLCAGEGNFYMGGHDKLVRKIMELKEKRGAVIAAHNYQADEIQGIADITGDSFALARYCARNDAKVIVLCGVRFMAESAAILSPAKTVLLPEPDAGCPMADMVAAEALREEKKRRPGAAVVCYINSSAEVKAESDICCTSSNAVDVVRAVAQKDVIFVPDMNLGAYISAKVPERRFFLWDGYCPVHHAIDAGDVERARKLHPQALLLVHPECRPEVANAADFVGSTRQIIDYVAESGSTEFVIGTERGVLYSMKKDNPGKVFHLLSTSLACPDMKKTTLASVYNALNEMRYVVKLDEEIRVRAEKALNRMLNIG